MLKKEKILRTFLNLPVDICGVASLRSGTVEGDLGYLGDFLRVSRPCFQNLNLKFILQNRFFALENLDKIICITFSKTPTYKKVSQNIFIGIFFLFQERQFFGDKCLFFKSFRQLDANVGMEGLKRTLNTTAASNMILTFW